jgi:hypothetical protein
VCVCVCVCVCDDDDIQHCTIDDTHLRKAQHVHGERQLLGVVQARPGRRRRRRHALRGDAGLARDGADAGVAAIVI